jgi:CheY-like chemotaxis protein
VVTASLTQGRFVVRIRDTGIGIAGDVLPRVFEPFTQAQTALDRAQGGLGLGLTVVKRLVLEHGGDVDAHSDGPGLGSEFAIWLPLDPGHDSTAALLAGQHEALVTPRRVLVVDDNADFTEALACLLRAAGHQVRVVDHGAHAMPAVKEFVPDVVVLDLGLPGVDGLTVLTNLRAATLPQQPRVVVVSGYGQEADKQRSLLAGADHHVAKPVPIESLKALIESAGPPRPT